MAPRQYQLPGWLTRISENFQILLNVAGNGHGRHLMQMGKAFLLSLEFPKINLCVRRDNEAVIKFYDGLGYEEESAYYCGKRLIEDQ